MGHTTSNEIVEEFIQADTDRLAKIIEEYPHQIPVPVIADWWECSPESIRCALEQKQVFGLGFRQSGKCNRAFVIPTGAFVRWYMNM